MFEQLACNALAPITYYCINFLVGVVLFTIFVEIDEYKNFHWRFGNSQYKKKWIGTILAFVVGLGFWYISGTIQDNSVKFLCGIGLRLTPVFFMGVSSNLLWISVVSLGTTKHYRFNIINIAILIGFGILLFYMIKSAII